MIVIVLILSFCNMCRNSYINEAETQLSESAHELKFEIESALQQTDILVCNEYIMEGLDTHFDKNYKVIDFLSDLTSFVSGIEETEIWEIDRFIIYSENPTLVNSGYVRSASGFPSFDDIRNSAQAGMQYFRWKSTIDEDEKGRSYLTLYCYIPMKYDCITELKVFIDDIIPKDNLYSIKLTEWNQAKEETSYRFRREILDGFVLTAEVNKGMLYKQYAGYLMLLILCAAAFLIITFLLAERSLNKTMKDILGLIAGIESGDILANDQSERWNEIAVIKNKIVDLTNKINEISTREYQQEFIRKRLEIELLNAKINPHLIYNSLSVIKLVASKENCLEICDVADILIKYYRLVLNKGEDIISVALELEYMEKYISIYRISKMMDYEVDYDICEEAFELEIPHMLLQPILENVLVHGLNTSANPCISIGVYLEGDKLRLEIGDNGVGIDEAKVRSLNNRENLGYGLTCVMQRADYYYKGDFDFHIESKLGEGTTFTLTVAKNVKNTL